MANDFQINITATDKILAMIGNGAAAIEAEAEDLERRIELVLQNYRASTDHAKRGALLTEYARLANLVISHRKRLRMAAAMVNFDDETRDTHGR